MQGEEGASQIDIILANGAAWKAFAGFRLDYELVGVPGHVSLRIKLALPKFNTQMNVIKNVQAFKIEGDAQIDEENKEASWIWHIGTPNSDANQRELGEGNVISAYGNVCGTVVAYLSTLCKVDQRQQKEFKNKGGEARYVTKNAAAKSPSVFGAIALDSQADKMVKISLLAKDIAIKVTKLEEALENTKDANPIGTPFVQRETDGKKLLSLDALCLVKDVFATQGIGNWTSKDATWIKKGVSRELQRTGYMQLRGGFPGDEEADAASTALWSILQPSAVNVREEAFHITRMWKKLQREAGKNAEIPDLPGTHPPFQLPKKDEMDEWAKAAKEAARNKVKEVAKERASKDFERIRESKTNLGKKDTRN